MHQPVLRERLQLLLDDSIFVPSKTEVVINPAIGALQLANWLWHDA